MEGDYKKWKRKNIKLFNQRDNCWDMCNEKYKQFVHSNFDNFYYLF